jgi:hypothetical protein
MPDDNFASVAVRGILPLAGDFRVGFASRGDFALRRKRGRKERNTFPMVRHKPKFVTRLKIIPIALGAPIAPSNSTPL